MKLKLVLALSAIVLLVASCKTTEANYRNAYQQTVDAIAEASDVDDGNPYAETTPASFVIADGDTIYITVKQLRVVEKKGQPAQQGLLKAYNVAVAKFVQEFNARSVVDMLAAKGFDEGVFVAMDADKQYYVIVGSYPKASEARAKQIEIAKAKPIVMRAPMPVILYDPRKKTN